jgi:hypothetical protein
MNYEQKYKDALERARNLHKDAIDMGESLRAKQCEIIFPELGESEDERIRKELYDFCIKCSHGDTIVNHQTDFQRWATWLEKQKTSEETLQYLKENHSPSEVSDFQAAMNIAVAKAYDKGIKDGLEKQRKTNVAQTDSNDYVEIGGVKWATKNVGANVITDSGLYFQWGDTQGYTIQQVGEETGQKAFTWADYKYGDGINFTFTKYNEADGKTVLDSEDDAVTAAWGGNWRMPTHEEFQALVNATTSAWVENYLGSGVNGWFFTSNDDNSKTLFFPAAGYGGGVDVWDVGSDGYYWSRSLYTDGVGNARSLYFDDGGVYPNDNDNRYHGYPVRGVMK